MGEGKERGSEGLSIRLFSNFSVFVFSIRGASVRVTRGEDIQRPEPGRGAAEAAGSVLKEN